MNTKRIERIIYLFIIHPAVWAIPVALFVFWLLPPVFDKYTIDEISEKRVDPGNKICYFDIDNDGLSEEIILGNNEFGCFVKYTDVKGRSVQMNLRSKFDEENSSYDKILTGDYDNNGMDEVYVFTQAGDSVLLNAFDFTGKEFKKLLDSKLICRFNRRTGFSFGNVKVGKVTDLNGDGIKEVVFAVNAGFGRQPRGIFAYDFANDTVTRTPVMGVYCYPVFGDLDHDNMDEICVNNYAISNYDSKYDTSVPFNDWYHYNMVFDNDFSLLFPPQQFDGDHANTNFMIDKKNPSIIASIQITNDSSQVIQLTKYSNKGEVLKELKLSNNFHLNQSFVKMLQNRKTDAKILVYTAFESFDLYSTEFEHITTSYIAPGLNQLVVFDLDMDGIDEIISTTPELDKFVILRGDLSNPVYFHLKAGNETPSIYNNKRGNYGEYQIVMQVGDMLKVMTYEKNPFYWLKYPLLLFIYLSFFSIFYTFRKIQRKQAMRKYEAETRFAELQLVSFRNQFEPHFMFNILTNIGSVMIQGRQNESYEMLMKFSKLLRSILMSSSKVSRSLADELSFTSDYVNLQQIRFSGFFEFEVTIQEEINQQRLVPKMVLQTYVENAIKHGLSKRDKGGNLQIEIKEDDEKNLIFSIKDNGIGRAKAAELELESTGKGMHIMKQYYDLLNSNNKQKITETIIDLYDEMDQPAGTQIIVKIPEDFNFEK